MISSFHRRAWFWLGAACVALVAVHGALWWVATTRMEHALDTAVTELRAAGWTASFATPRRAGWPFAAAVEMADVQLSGPVAGLPGGLDWHAARLRGIWQPIRPRQFVLVAEGPQQLRLGPAAPLAITAGALQATLPLRRAGIARSATLTGSDVQLSTVGAPAARIASLGIVAGETPPDAGTLAARTLQITAGTIGLPPLAGGRSWALGAQISSLSLDLALTGPTGAGGGRRGAEAWRDAGGSLEVRHLALAWGPMTLTASAALKLDAELQPAGSGRIDLAGYDATINALVAAGVLAPRAAVATRAVATLLARPGAEGKPPYVEVPLRLENRLLSAGNFALTRLPPWTWPED